MDTMYLSSYRTATARLIFNLFPDQQADGAINHPISSRLWAYYFFSHKPWCSKEHIDKTYVMKVGVCSRDQFAVCNQDVTFEPWPEKGAQIKFPHTSISATSRSLLNVFFGVTGKKPNPTSSTKYLLQSHQWIHTTHLLFIWWLNVIKERKKMDEKKGGA